LAIEARERMKLRHVPLLLVREMALTPRIVIGSRDTVRVIQRADELAEFLAITGRMAAAIVRAGEEGLAAAFTRFDAYALAKYDELAR